MNRRRLRRVLILAVAAALCLAMAVISSAAEKNSGLRLTLWYDEGECSPAVMENLAALCQREAGLRIELQGFPDETAMGLAFEEKRPDLVYCSASRADGFEKCARLGAAGDALPLSEGLRALSPEIGESFFPIGGRLPLLLVNTALVTQTHDTLESLLAAADGSAFLASDDWAELLYTAMCAEGAPMAGDPAEDTNNKTFRRLYKARGAAGQRFSVRTSHADADERAPSARGDGAAISGGAHGLCAARGCGHVGRRRLSELALRRKGCRRSGARFGSRPALGDTGGRNRTRYGPDRSVSQRACAMVRVRHGVFPKP